MLLSPVHISIIAFITLFYNFSPASTQVKYTWKQEFHLYIFVYLSLIMVPDALINVIDPNKGY